jgi:hypothetical protein
MLITLKVFSLPRVDYRYRFDFPAFDAIYFRDLKSPHELPLTSFALIMLLSIALSERQYNGQYGRKRRETSRLVTINYIIACACCWYQSYNTPNAANTLNYAPYP